MLQLTVLIRKEVKFCTKFLQLCQLAEEGKFIQINDFDVIKIADIIYNSIFKEYPGLYLIYTYLTEMANILNKLDLPVRWFTPNGLELTQKYYASKVNKMTVTLGGRTNTFVLREPLNKLDKTKQKGSIIPNVIHSLDANHAANVINYGFDNGIKNIITIHDCFGTHPNYMDKLFEIIKLEFVKLYAEELFLCKFHERNLENIQDHGFTIERDPIKEQDYIMINRSKLLIPSKVWVLRLL